MTIKQRGGARVGAGRKPTPLDQRRSQRGKVWIGITPAAALQLQQLMLRGIPGVRTPEQMVEYLIRKDKTMTDFRTAIEARDWYEAAQALRPLCNTSVDGLDTWLADGDVAYIMSRTPEQLAAEWDAENADEA